MLRWNSRISRYEIDIYESGRSGRRLRRRMEEGTTSEEAEAQHKAALKHFQKLRSAPSLDLGLTISRICEKYLEWYELHRAATTIRDVKGVFAGPVNRLLGGLPAEDLLQDHIQDYQRKRLAETVGRTRVINKELSYLSGCLRWSEKRGLISPRSWRMEMLPYRRPIPAVLSVDEVRAIIDHADPVTRAYLLLLYGVGLRHTEARMVRETDIDRASNTLIVRQKGGSFKRLPIPTTCLSSIDEIVKYRATSSDFPEIFANPATGKPQGDFRKGIRRACKKAGITRRVTPHLFRHSFATHLLSADVSIRVIQELLGHKEINTTQFYAQVDQGRKTAASNVIELGLIRARNKAG